MIYENKRNLTIQSIQESLLACIQEKPINKITVNDIITKARLTRSSFYNYFDDKYDLIETMENQIINIMHSDNSPAITKPDKAHLMPVIMSKFTLLEPHNTAINLLLGPNGDPSFETKLRQVIYDRMFKSHGLTVKRALIDGYIVSIMIQTLRTWPLISEELSTEDLADIISHVMLEGFVKPMSD